MNTAKVVISEVQSNSGAKILDLLAEGIGEPRKASAHHSQGQILSFDVRRTDIALVGITNDSLGYRLNEPGWSVTLPPWWKMAVNLLELTKVNRGSERRFNRRDVRSPRIGRELRMQAPRGSRIHITHKCERVGEGALASKPRENQLTVGVHGDERVLFSDFIAFFDGNHALALLNEAVQLVALDSRNRQVLQLVAHHRSATLCRNQQQTHDRVAVQSGQSLSSADRAAVNETANHQFSNVGFGSESAPRQFDVRFAESGIAGLATPPLDAALTEVAELLAGLVLASHARHGLFSACVLRRKPYNQFGSGLRLTPRFGLAPTKAATDAGAIYCYLAIWWRSRHGLLPRFSHRSALIQQSGSHLVPKSFKVREFILPLLQQHRGMLNPPSQIHCPVFCTLSFQIRRNHSPQGRSYRGQWICLVMAKVEADFGEGFSHRRGRQQFVWVLGKHQFDCVLQPAAFVLDHVHSGLVAPLFLFGKEREYGSEQLPNLHNLKLSFIALLRESDSTSKQLLKHLVVIDRLL